MVNTKTGQRIRKLRESLGYSKRGLALKAGINRQSIIHWESGRSEPTAASVRRIAPVLGVSFSYLFTGRK